MFGSLGFPEILFILVLALLVFGPKKLPEVGRTIGRALGEFRRATGDLKRSFDQEMNAAPSAEATPASRPAAAGANGSASDGQAADPPAEDAAGGEAETASGQDE